MADIHNGEFNTVSIEDKTAGYDLAVNSDGSINENLAKIAGAAPSATNPMPSRQTDGSAFIDPRMIVDGTTPTRKATVDASGRVAVYIAPASGSIPIELSIDALTTALNANEWQDIYSYTIPAGYSFSPVQFQIISAQVADDARTITKGTLATYVSTTNTFTDGSAYTAPAFASSMYLYITTTIGNVANDTVTITYTNQAGTTGRTATVSVPKNTAAGTRLLVTLQAGDYGVTDITNITHTSTSQTGAWTMEGTVDIVYESAGTANVIAEAVLAAGSISIAAGLTIVTQYRSSVNTAKQRRISLIGSLIPTT